MRITNTMMTNSTLININRNQRYLDKIVRQIESTKKINVPSDDPIIASRALKFRTNVAETEQYQRNVQNGMSWMEISEAPLTDINKNLMAQLKELLTEGATGTETHSDKMALITDLKEVVAQIGLDMNAAYAGRYAFSGYRTDQPPLLIEDNATMSYAIEQTFLIEDIENVMSYQKLSTTGVATKFEDVPVLKLAYKPDGSANEDVRVFDASGNEINVIVRHLNDATAYDNSTDPPMAVIYIPETGELVFDKTAAVNPALFGEGMKVQFTKTGFRQGELNPIVYFPCTDLNDSPAANRPPAGGAAPFANYQYDMEDQEIQYEFASNTYITVNTLAKDTYTDKMYADMQRLIAFTESLTVSDQKVLEEHYTTQGVADVEKAVTDQLSDETALMNSAMHDRFNNMLYLLDRHSSDTATAQTQLGSRMMRLELLQTRLEEDYVSYEKLKSENEDTEMEFAIMQRANAMAALEASLRANANIVQLTLANYI